MLVIHSQKRLHFFEGNVRNSVSRIFFDSLNLRKVNFPSADDQQIRDIIIAESDVIWY